MFKDTLFSVVVEKLAVTKSRLTDTETGSHDECGLESSAIFPIRNADSNGKVLLQTFSGILVLLKNTLMSRKGGGPERL